MNQERDLALDLLKGLGCVLMIFAHVISPTIQNGDLALLMVNAGHFAPLFFFAAAGATAALQVQRYRASRLITTYLALALFGLFFGVCVQPDFYRLFDMEILQIIAAGCIAVVLVERFLRPAPSVYLVLGLALIVLKFGLEHFWPELPGAGVIYPYHDGELERRWLAGQPIPLPGFPLLPWVGLFLLGVGVYRMPNRANLALGVIATALLIALMLSAAPENMRDLGNKWNMSVAYALCALAEITFAFYFARRFSSFWQGRPSTLVFWGQNSLIFLHVHLIAAIVIGVAQVLNQWLAWALAILLVMGLMRWFVRRKPWPIFESLSAWAALAALAISLPLLAAINPALGIPARLIALGCGLIFAINYPSLCHAVKENKPATGALAKNPA